MRPSSRNDPIRLGSFLLAAASLALWPGLVLAHGLNPALLDIRETAAGRAEVSFKQPIAWVSRERVTPILPPACEMASAPVAAHDGVSWTETWTVDCNPDGLAGEIAVRGLPDPRSEVLVRLALEDGRTVHGVLQQRQSVLPIPAEVTILRVARDYLVLGVEHILFGVDHLVFVLGLLFLVHAPRRLLFTVSSFTLGHSVTLSIVTLGLFTLPSAMVETAIAASIFVLALEMLRPREAPATLLQRYPWAVAFAFGLLHGMGFAGALAEVGLPPAEIPAALLSFNAGIELGQIAFILAMLALGRLALLARPLVRKIQEPSWRFMRALPAHAIGGLAAFWCLERGLALF